MTVSNTTVRTDAVGDNVATVFAFGFLILREADISVYLDGVLQATGFTITGTGNQSGGNCTFDVAPASAVKVALIRASALTQQTDYVPFDAFPAETHERALDDGVLIDQELSEQADRSLHYGITSDPAFDSELPDPLPNRAIGYDSQGELANVSIGVGGTPVVNPLLEDLLSGGFDYVITGDPGSGFAVVGAFGPDIPSAPTKTIFTGTTFDILGVLQVAGDPVVVEAPIDGFQYGRLDGAWARLVSAIVSDTAPMNAANGTLWFNSASGRLLVRYADVDSEQWIEAGPAPGPQTGEAGVWSFVERATGTAVADLTFNHILEADTDYEIQANITLTAAGRPLLQVKEAGVFVVTGSYNSIAYGSVSSVTVDATFSAGGVGMFMTRRPIDDVNPTDITLRVMNAADATLRTQHTSQSMGFESGGTVATSSGGGARGGAATAEGLRLIGSAGVMSGSANLYKRRNF